MKRLFLFFLLSGCSSISNSSQLSIFDTKILLNEFCQIEVIKKSKKTLYPVPFKNPKTCRVISHEHTDVPNIKYVNGMYVLLVENNMEKGNNCHSEYTAVGVNNNGDLFTTARVKRSSACYQGKEAKSFEYFSSFLKPLP